MANVRAVSPSGATSSQIVNCPTIHSARRCACWRFALLRFSIAVGKAAAMAHSFHARLSLASSSFCNRFAALLAWAMPDANGRMAGGARAWVAKFCEHLKALLVVIGSTMRVLRAGGGKRQGAALCVAQQFPPRMAARRRCAAAGGWRHGEALRRLCLDAKAR